MKHIIREVPAEQTDFSFYFEDDGLKETGGNYCYNLFIVAQSSNSRGFNEEAYGDVQNKAECIIDGFSDVSDKWTNGYNSYATYKECMEYNDIAYTSRRCHLLKEWVKNADISDTDDMAKFLTIITGKQWATDNAHGYCQGDYVEMVYCPEHYTDGVKHYGEIWLGAAKEFDVIYLDDNGEETDACGGYIVADCQARTDEDYKRLVCEWAEIPKDETQLEMIDGYRTVTEYTYRKIA
jgi:hypothetical protein